MVLGEGALGGYKQPADNAGDEAVLWQAASGDTLAGGGPRTQLPQRACAHGCYIFRAHDLYCLAQRQERDTEVGFGGFFLLYDLRDRGEPGLPAGALCQRCGGGLLPGLSLVIYLPDRYPEGGTV